MPHDLDKQLHYLILHIEILSMPVVDATEHWSSEKKNEKKTDNENHNTKRGFFFLVSGMGGK